MKYDELAFVNQQLAGMLRSGIPLEGALGQLSGTMQRGELRGELEQLESDLAKGKPLVDALAGRRLPDFYRQMLQVGVRSNDLPGVLTLLADYYQSLNSVWVRLKGLMVYPLIVLVSGLVMSLALAALYMVLVRGLADEQWLMELTRGVRVPVGLWILSSLLFVLVILVWAGLFLPGWRRRLRWRVPGFREASLSQMASALAMLLKGGCTLAEAIRLMAGLESGTPAGSELEQWQNRLAAGQGKFSEMAGGGKVFPPLFIWLVGSSGENLVHGFQNAAEFYYGRAVYRIELLLYAAMPVSVLVLGVLIISQITPLFRVLTSFIDTLGGGMDLGS